MALVRRKRSGRTASPYLKALITKSPKQNNALFLHNGTMRLTSQSETFFIGNPYILEH